jgi:hypothetical protein
MKKDHPLHDDPSRFEVFDQVQKKKFQREPSWLLGRTRVPKQPAPVSKRGEKDILTGEIAEGQVEVEHPALPPKSYEAAALS